MEKSKEKRQITRKKTTAKKNVTNPFVDSPMISVPKNPFSLPIINTDSLNEIVKKETVSQKIIVENNLNSIVETINNFNTSKTFSKNYNQEHELSKYVPIINYFDVLNDFSNIFKTTTSPVEAFAKLNELFLNEMKWNFVGIGLYHDKSKCIDLKIHSDSGNCYSSKIFLSDEKNPIIQCFNRKIFVENDNSEYLINPYLNKSGSVIFPMMSAGKCIGIMIAGVNTEDINKSFVTHLSDYLGLYIHNIQLEEQANTYANTDTLTTLLNHRGFQEVLAKGIENAKNEETPLSVVMFDVNNISKINRELGHAKGDEVIKVIADKVKQNIRNTDFAGRYGGDEIAIIMPNTDTRDAKYLAEYITYCLSCCFIDDVGPVKVSVGISTYPQCTRDQEKLLILAEQAMFISQAKGYKEGMSAIVSSSDFNFWDDVALDSFAEVITKRHSQIGINFEEELVHKFNQEEIVNHNHLMEMVTSLAGAIDAKDPYTKGHSTSVSRYSEALARAINLPEHEVERIKIGALLHDVGKIGIPENVLKKPGKLTDEEWQIMKQHPVIGAEKVLAPNEALHDLIPIVKYHHERLDGKGYPEGLKGNEIPLASRIVSVADAYHALVSDRPYRKGLPIDVACNILKEGAGTQWDADLVRQFITIAPSLTTKV